MGIDQAHEQNNAVIKGIGGANNFYNNNLIIISIITI